jgi:hypothetical protein
LFQDQWEEGFRELIAYHQEHGDCWPGTGRGELTRGETEKGRYSMNKPVFAPYAPRCGAYARTTGKPCKKAAMANGRCRNHGGRSLKGKESPKYKHGLRSKDYLAARKTANEINRILKELMVE